MVADPSDGGIWFWAQDGLETTLFNVSSAAEVSRFDIGDAPADGMSTGELTPITMDQAGHVWIGAGSTVIRFDRTTHKTSAWTIPLASLAGYSNLSSITNLAVASNGDLAIIVGFARGVLILDPATGISSVLNTSQSYPDAVVSLITGSLVVGSGDFRGSGGAIQWIDADGHMTTTPVSAIHLSAYKDSVLFTQGDLYSMQQGHSPVLIARGQSIDSNPNGLDLDEPVAATPVGDIVATTNSGLEVMSPGGTPLATLVLPRLNCSNMAPPFGVTVSPKTTCSQRAEPITTDSEGNIFFFTSGENQLLQELSPPAVPPLTNH